MSGGHEPPRSWDELEAAGLLGGVTWEYVAAEDACPVGRTLDGRRFGSLASLYEHLPGFAENPACTRRPCTCTALPARAGDTCQTGMPSGKLEEQIAPATLTRPGARPNQSGGST